MTEIIFAHRYENYNKKRDKSLILSYKREICAIYIQVTRKIHEYWIELRVADGSLVVMARTRRTYLRDHGVQQQKRKQRDEHRRTMEAQHRVTNDMVDCW